MKLRSLAQIIAFAPLAIFAACSGSTVGTPGTSDSGASDGATSDAGCLAAEPTVGSVCTTDQSVCSTGDACCVGYVWSCDAIAHTWQKQGLGCPCQLDAGRPKGDAGPLCGAVTCGPDEYCKEASGGAQPLDGGSNHTMGCEPVPASCINASVATCACLQASGAGGCTCSDGAAGPHVTCNYP